uniref:Fur-regulated basic protein FbpA n=1 Tax=Geobacillus sp. (strain Y4.1MC1) TaxID=581103 RepID=A0A7U3YCR5_GEOS0
MGLLLKYVLIQRLRRKGIFRAADGRAFSKLTLEEVQREYERVEGENHDGLVQGDAQTISNHSTL